MRSDVESLTQVVSKLDAKLAVAKGEVGEASRLHALRESIKGEISELEVVITGKAQLETLMAHHGQANGVFGANECLGGRDPSIGTETCVVVEQMESMAQMFQASGDLSYMDSLEEIAFNALPAPFFNGTMGAMKYFQETDHYDADRYSQV